jgi:hypothetical protein
MPFGTFHPAEDKVITTMYGDQVPLKTPAGYGGLFWGHVYDSDGKQLCMASEYFLDLGKTDHPEDDFKYWYDIDELIHRHCMKYVHPYRGDTHHYQSGFGGDDCDGLIDFWLTEQVPEMPDMPFEIAGTQYVLKWTYSPGSMDADE